MKRRFLPIFNAALVTALVLGGCGKSTGYKQPKDDDDTVYISSRDSGMLLMIPSVRSM